MEFLVVFLQGFFLSYFSMFRCFFGVSFFGFLFHVVYMKFFWVERDEERFEWGDFDGF